MPQAEPILHSFQNDTAFRTVKGGENPGRCGRENQTGGELAAPGLRFPSWATEESNMPVLLLWAVPAVIVVGGVGYYLVHAVH
jgi:hypothetical protein